MSRRAFRVWACLLTCFLGTGHLCAQAPAATPSIKAKAEDVVLDIVVRDKKGHLVTDLKPEDFEVLDNGVPKKIDGFRLLQGNEAISGSGTRAQLDPLRQIRLITIVFESSSLDARRIAHDAAEALLKSELPQNVYIAVMKIDFNLKIVQGYTNDVALLRKAIDAVAHGASTDFTRDAQQLREQLEHELGPDFDDPMLRQSRQTSSQTGISAYSSMATVLLGIYAKTKKAEDQQSGRVYISALLDVVEQQYRLPGRKTVLYFTEGGFKIPENGDQWVRNLISIANRSNVSLYAIDTTGLTSSDPNRDALTQSHGAGAVNVGVKSASDDLAGNLETVADITRANPQMNLSYIAESTGGALIANMNDFRDPLRKVVEDLETHYEISYSPGIKTYDGSFHNISVKLKESGFHVQSRSGYFALPPTLGPSAELKAYEIPLLKALSSEVLPRDFAFRAVAMHFRDEKKQPQYVLTIDVPFSEITLTPKDKSFEGHFAYEVLLKDDSGEVVRKFQSEVPLLVPADKLDALKQSRYIYTEPFRLPPGHYTLEAAVLDSQKGNRLSARKTSLIVPPANSSLQLSSVTFVRNVGEMHPKEGDLKPDNPLQVGSRVISPDLAPVASRSASNLSFYVVAYTDTSINEAPSLVMELSQGGVVLGATKIGLGKPDDQGRIQYLGTIPAGALSPGDYTVRFVLQQGTERAQEAAFFKVK